MPTSHDILRVKTARYLGERAFATLAKSIGTDLTTQLRGFFPLADATGDAAIDYSTYKNNGTITGASLISSRMGRAMSFDGVDDLVTVPKGSAIDEVFNGGGTLYWEWIPLTTANDNGVLRKSAAIQITQQGTSGSTCKLRFIHNFSTTAGRWETGTIFTLGNIYRVAIVYDRGATANNPVIYVNGASVTVTRAIAPAGLANSDAGGDMTLALNSTAYASLIARNLLIWKTAKGADFLRRLTNKYGVW